MKKDVIYVLYSLHSPYLPVDFADTLQEISIRYNIPLKTLRNYCGDEKHVFRSSFTIAKVLIED